MRRGRFHRVHDEKRYFLSQKMMRENRWAQARYHAIINRGEETCPDVIGVTAGTHPCSCGCGGTSVAVFSKDVTYELPKRQNIKTKRLVTFEINGKEVC